MNFPRLIATERIGQLTGSTDTNWPDLVDPEHWPLLTDTGKWGAIGTDLGANTEHNGRTYIFFGDTATHEDQSGIPGNADMVAWIGDPEVLRHGGHFPQGWNFILPFEPTGLPGQHDWRFCGKCGSLFWNGDPGFKGYCPNDHGPHQVIGLNFVIPAAETGSQDGQPDWRFCGKCAGLFWNGGDFKGVCPMDGAAHSAIGWNFHLPFVIGDYQGSGINEQPDWRFCGKCAGLFWNGSPHRGVCMGAPGGGLRLNAVVQPNGNFAPFCGSDPIGLTLSLETPNGAFSYAGKVWVFAGFADPQYSGHSRPGDPAPGCYLTSNAQPEIPGIYQKEFLFSPNIGWCPRDVTRDRLESHEPLGWKFLVSHDIAVDAGWQTNYRRCRKCASLFWAGDPTNQGICHKGGTHQSAELNYALRLSTGEDGQNQANWRRCAKCASLFWNGADNPGLCPAGDGHVPTELDLLLAHPSLLEDGTNQANWRFCGKCGSMFWDGDPQFKGQCPKDGAGHASIGFNFLLPHDIPEDDHNQQQWRFCAKCAGLFWNGDPFRHGICPVDREGHSAVGYNFVLPHDLPENLENQANWRFCGKCFSLFWDGDQRFKGECPLDGAGHSSIGFNFVVPHNPGEDFFTEGGWRYCVRCHSAVWTRQEALFAWVAPWVVRNSDHPHLPPTPIEQGLVMFGFFYSSKPGVRLAWMPLRDPAPPMMQDILYYTGDSQAPWSPDVESATILFSHTNTYTHLSAMWMRDVQKWIILYSNANDESGPAGYPLPVVARIGSSLLDWSEETPIFNPKDQGAYTRYMHKAGSGDGIHPNIPPAEDTSVRPEHDGWAYGAFILSRYTTWDENTGELDLHYLLSLSSPYQVQLMHTRLMLA